MNRHVTRGNVHGGIAYLCLPLLISVLLGVGSAGAVGQVDDVKELCQPDTMCQIIYTDCTDKGCKKTAYYPCLAKMESAMRGYDKFVNYGLMPGKPEDIKERASAIVQWDNAKRECWTK